MLSDPHLTVGYILFYFQKTLRKISGQSEVICSLPPPPSPLESFHQVWEKNLKSKNSVRGLTLEATAAARFKVEVLGQYEEKYSYGIFTYQFLV